MTSLGDPKDGCSGKQKKGTMLGKRGSSDPLPRLCTTSLWQREDTEQSGEKGVPSSIIVGNNSMIDNNIAVR